MCSLWGIRIYIVKYNQVEMFIGYVPVGAAGSGLAYFEAYAAGAEVIVRYGSDDSEITHDDLYNYTLVECADNLTGLLAAIELPEKAHREIVHADKLLISAIKHTAPALGITVRSAICHHVEDYHFYRFPESLRLCLLEVYNSNNQSSSATIYYIIGLAATVVPTP